MNSALFDKYSTSQVIGCVMKKPEYIDEYNLVDADFEVDDFYRVVFGTIKALYKNGVKVIDTFAINSFLISYPTQYQIFNEGNGTDYCNNSLKISEEGNIEYYVSKLKKFSFLRFMEARGFDVKKLYDWTITDSVLQEKEAAKLDAMTVSEMVDKVEASLILDAKVQYCCDTLNKGQLAGQGMKELKESLKETPDTGLPLQSPILSVASRGMRMGKVYVRSASSGTGKSRMGLADICGVSIPWIYDLKNKKWVYTGRSAPALFISTELELDELRTIIQAYVSGVQEDHILNGKYEKGEEERVDQAIQYIESASLYLEFMPNFSIQDIELAIKKYNRTNGVCHVCFDYVHMSAKLIGEISNDTRGMKLREDQILFLFIDRLKNLCTNLGVFLLTMTQLNGTYKDSPIKDESMLRGSKAIADRIDMGEITLPPTSTDLNGVKQIIAAKFKMKTPNMVHHIYKLRRGKYSKIKIWQYADLGNCRTEDLFVTNYDNDIVPINPLEIEAKKVEEVIEQESVKLSEIENGSEQAEVISSVAFSW